MIDKTYGEITQLDKTTVLEATHISFGYAGPKDPNPVIRDVSLSIGRGQSLALMGVSGTGKSTLLHVLGLLDSPTSGEVKINGVATSACRDDDKTILRRCSIGFVYQFHHLLHDLNSLENVMMPLLIGGHTWAKARKEALDLLHAVHLSDHIDHFPSQLSGGQKQRVAIARALANSPSLVLADEPTGNLDEHHAQGVFDLLLSLVKGRGLSLIVVTHHAGLAQQCDRIRWLSNGVLHDCAPS